MLESLLELAVHVDSDVLRGAIELVHEVLECHVPRFLEPHVIIESLGYYLVHLGFEFQQPYSEFYRLLLQGLIFDNLFAFLHDERVHLLDHKLEGRFHTKEDIIHETELVNFSIVKHVRASHFHVRQICRL